MRNIESETTKRNFEHFKNTPEWEIRQEKERKLVPLDPHSLDRFKPFAYPLEQLYLSHPNDEFSLRLRAYCLQTGTEYTATLKDRGKPGKSGLHRLEVETEINKSAYEYFERLSIYPRLKKLRAEISNGVIVDFMDQFDAPLVEIDEGSDTSLLSGVALEDHSHNPLFLNESIAHRSQLVETLKPSDETIDQFAERIALQFETYYMAGISKVAIGISGMSGSGKSTAAQAIQQVLNERYGDEFTPVVVSTDDYHHGKNWLEKTYGAPWLNWDDPRVYNTKQMSEDLQAYLAGEPLLKRHFDFIKEEVVIDEVIPPRPFVLIEGLYADSADFEKLRWAHFEVPASPAVSIGRDVRRLVVENRANGVFGSPEERLRYQIETAYPTYLETRQNPRNRVFRSWLDRSRLVARPSSN